MEVRSKPSQYKVELLPHDPNWKNLYDSEAKELTAIFGDELFSIHHIGSTSIPSIKAKPIIDILIETKSETILENIIQKLDQRGYTERLFDDGRARRTFNKEINGVRLYNVHVFKHGNDFGLRMLRFCEILRENLSLAKEYEVLKLKNASETDKAQSYYDAKLYFFEKVLK